MATYTYTVLLEPAEEGGYVVTVPALPGCVTQGETYEEAVTMAQECIEGFLEALIKVGEQIPLEPPPSEPVEMRLIVTVPAAA